MTIEKLHKTFTVDVDVEVGYRANHISYYDVMGLIEDGLLSALNENLEGIEKQFHYNLGEELAEDIPRFEIPEFYNVRIKE